MSTLRLQEGYAEGRPVRYMAAGQTPLSLSNMYVLIRGYDPKGGPLLLARHKQILDSIPGMSEYSALRLVHFVEVPPNMPVDTIRSEQDVMKHALRLRTPGMVVNAPVVSLDSDSSVYPVVPAWQEGQMVGYLDIGPMPIRAGHVYQCIRGIERSTGDIVPVQNAKLIFDTLPHQPSYSPIWRLHYVRVPDHLDKEKLRSVQDIQKQGLPIRPTNTYLNAPIPDLGL